MKKEWLNPEVKNLELNLTNEELECADQSEVMPVDGNCGWKCHHNPSPQVNGCCTYRIFEKGRFVCKYNPVQPS